MIRTIQTVRRFGVFREFRWSAELPEFKRFNLIYGWNYSGKTTLSRAFRCFEQQKRHADFPDAEAHLKGDDGTDYFLSSPENAPVFRVFNTDFIRDNLRFEDGTAEPILVLSEVDIAKQDELKHKREERQKLAEEIATSTENATQCRAAIEEALTKYAKDFIKTQLSVPDYNKTRFKPRVEACESDPSQFLLNEQGLQQALSFYNRTEKKSALSAKSASFASVTQLKARVAPILARIVTANNPIPRLKQNPSIEKWVNEGRPLHEGKAACQFCDQPLPEDLLTRLSEHFSEEYEKLMADIDTALEAVRSGQKERILLDHRSDFYPDLQERFAGEERRLRGLLERRASALSSLQQAIVEKKRKAFTSMSCPDLADPANEINEVIDVINRIIEEHNTRTSEFDKKRRETLRVLENHYAAKFIRDKKYVETSRRAAELDTTVEQGRKRLDGLDVEIRALEGELSETSKGAERINELLSAYFGKDDVRVAVGQDKRFRIVRHGAVAKNLSEGEKTAIAFAHFITRVQDNRQPLSETIVVIDDPVSSLDANHLFNTYALTKTQLADCRQLFIATHNFEFYSLIRDWVEDDERKERFKRPQTEWKHWTVFYVRRTGDGNAVLEEIPRELLRFRSEYHYLFSILYNFDKNGTEDFEFLLSLPNVARRFLEAFGGIMIPRSETLRKKISELFSNEIERERVWKFINHYSHNRSIKRSLTIPDMGECKAVVRACLEAVRKWNRQYFEIMEREVDN